MSTKISYLGDERSLVRGRIYTTHLISRHETDPAGKLRITEGTDESGGGLHLGSGTTALSVQ